MRELIEKVKQWGLDRGIVFTGADGQDKQAMMEAQARKTLEETAELLDVYAKQDIDKINDAIGDTLVTLIVGASSDEDCFGAISNKLCGYFDDSLSEDDSFMSAYRIMIMNIDMLLTRIERSVFIESMYNDIVYPLRLILKWANNDYNQSLTLKDCLELAYNEIKNRTGRVVNGQFVKGK